MKCSGEGDKSDMRKEQVLSKMREECLIAVIRAKNPEQGEKIVEAVIAGGIHFIEITMTMEEGNPVQFISAMSEKYRNDDRIVIGAGTVLDPETARQVILAGANYVVSPGLNLDTIKLCNRYRIPMLPGVMTPTEAIAALEAGCDVIKLFPGNILGPAAISTFKGPLPQGEFMPSGGVDVASLCCCLGALLSLCFGFGLVCFRCFCGFFGRTAAASCQDARCHCCCQCYAYYFLFHDTPPYWK